ncbi:hypothetical protein A7P95_03285 [Eikenella longinqua]|uniref:Mechanosensitive ion channel MscS domain-containing protein n=1 Tax=Eikenella longinqua TaxID=1795827 RepID=A0A1A9RZM1_9NEIS|nr:mechanosensitive ion channel family protein [Eikenella longinqua]OAM30054.1 hypothetical protein A7P95_03285 [Eikenella longinqua]
MWNTLQNWLHGSPTAYQWLGTLLLVPGVLLARLVLLRLYFRRHPRLEIDEMRRALVVSRNMGLIVCALGLFAVWFAQIQTFALSMVALAAATVLATKELIMCLSGSLMRMLTKQYSVGDFIEIGGIRGRVVDINMFNTLVMEIGPNALVEHMSGQAVSFPNSLVLAQPLRRDNVFGSYVVHTFEVPVPIALDPAAVLPPLRAVLERLCAPETAAIAAYLEQVQAQRLFITPAAEPHIGCVPFDDKLYKLAVRFAAPLPRRLAIQQAVLDEFMRVQHRLLAQAGREEAT